MTEEEALKLQPGDKVIYSLLYDEPLVNDKYILDQQKENGGFVEVIGLGGFNNMVFVKVNTPKNPNELYSIAHHDEIELYNRSWSYELDY
jgi:hypothetical protein